MSRSGIDGSRGSAPRGIYYGPVVGIVVLLACWFVIAEWQVLPQVISHTMAALP